MRNTVKAVRIAYLSIQGSLGLSGFPDMSNFAAFIVLLYDDISP